MLFFSAHETKLAAPTWFVPAILVMLVFYSGCLLKQSDASLHLESLKLNIALNTKQVHVGEKIILKFELTNISPVSMKVYLRTGRSNYSLGGTEKLLGLLNTVDHPSPNRVVWLKPGQSIEWNEQIEILPVGTGRARLSANVEIYHPQSCDKYGCDGVSISSNNIELEIIE